MKASTSCCTLTSYQTIHIADAAYTLPRRVARDRGCNGGCLSLEFMEN